MFGLPLFCLNDLTSIRNVIGIIMPPVSLGLSYCREEGEVRKSGLDCLGLGSDW